MLHSNHKEISVSAGWWNLLVYPETEEFIHFFQLQMRVGAVEINLKDKVRVQANSTLLIAEIGNSTRKLRRMEFSYIFHIT